MTIYEVLLFLQNDGGFYDVKGHLDLLTSQFPKVSFDDRFVKNLRNTITRSISIKCERKIVDGVMKLRVAYVSPRYGNYSKAAIGIGKKRELQKWTYLEGEHPETVNAILQRQLFDKLLRENRGCYA